MRLEVIILGITIFFIYNSYHDGKYTKLLLSYKRYYQMAFFGLIGLSVYLLLKRNPVKGRNMLMYANNVVKYMPIDKSSMDMISPLFDFTSSNKRSFMESFNDIGPNSFDETANMNYKEHKSSFFGKPTKRSVNGMTKKYVAYCQNWKCGDCQTQLDHTFEVDHKIRLEYGGSNDKTNLIALCRNCHGKKTAQEMMDF